MWEKVITARQSEFNKRGEGGGGGGVGKGEGDGKGGKKLKKDRRRCSSAMTKGKKNRQKKVEGMG